LPKPKNRGEKQHDMHSLVEPVPRARHTLVQSVRRAGSSTAPVPWGNRPGAPVKPV